MKLKLLFLCLFLAMLLMPAEMKRKKHHKHRDHKGRDHHQPEHPKQSKYRETFNELLYDVLYNILGRDGDGDGGDDDDDDDDQSIYDWLSDLIEPQGQCNPNPCLNNGECEKKGKNNYKCDCPKPYKGIRCEKGPKVCKTRRCGRGECVLISTPPFYECKCKEPFKPPSCRAFALCEPNPCKNGGKCVKDGKDFECECPVGYRGRFCHVGPNDCYVDDGESYRGNVSETDDGYQCLYWNSHFILENGEDPFNSFEDEDGLGPHNFCRNPDGELMPWCFYRRGRRLLWDYCDVTECPEPTGVAPTETISPETDPTSPHPQPTKPEPTTPHPQPTTPEPMTPHPQPTTPEPTTPHPQPTKPEPTTPHPQPTTETEPTAATHPTTTTSLTTEPSQVPQTSPAPTEVLVIPNATAPPQQFSTCGKPQPKKAITKIYGGRKVIPGALPWQVSVQVRPKNSNNPFSHICGGVLIESCWVLTAGHCLETMRDMQVVLGSLLLDMETPTEQTLSVEKAILHQNYRETPLAVYNDIALLKLNGTDGACAKETQFVKTACLPDAQLPDGMECTISGWGSTEDSQFGSNHLLQASALLINQEKCSEPEIYGNALDSTMFCAGHLQGGVDSCQGDSGGPLTCQQNNAHVIYGLVSWGDQCGRQNKPGVYTRVTHYRDWIKYHTQAAFP